MSEIWRVKVSDGITQYFDNRHEAEFFAKDTAEAGFTVTTSPVPLPKTLKAFVAFMERQESDRRHAEILLAEIEAITPNWRGYRSLSEAVGVAIHNAAHHP